MNYEYVFYRSGSTEDIASTISTTEPLPHIQVGHSLLLESDVHSQTMGYHLEIRHVEVYLFAPQTGAPPNRVRVSVYTLERDRKAIPEILRA